MVSGQLDAQQASINSQASALEGLMNDTNQFFLVIMGS